MNGTQIATWIILGVTFFIQGYTFWLMRKTAKLRKRTAETYYFSSKGGDVDHAAVAQETARRIARGEH